MTAGVVQQGDSVDGIAWNILGQTYKPLQVTESSFSWHAVLPPGTFVPPHIHPTQDEFIYIFEGLGGRSRSAAARHSPWPVQPQPIQHHLPVLGVADAPPVGPVPRDPQHAGSRRSGAHRRLA
jgi:hypothetical protein